MADPATVSQFISITGSDEATAVFFLSASFGNCDAAVSAFFESGGSTAPPPTAPSVARPARPSARPSSSASGIATLNDMRKESGEQDGYYVGGEKSGQVVQPRKSDDDDKPSPNVADQLLEQARERGPRTEEEREQFEGAQFFSGAGYRLGNEEGDARQPAVVGRRNVTHVLTFYANGFVVDDGPLRRFDDPANDSFLKDIKRGNVPQEMEEAGMGDVSVTLKDKKGEEYVEPKKRIVPFSGGGQRLDGGAAMAGTINVGEVDAEGAAAALMVDESKPVASVQVRLSDGTRLVARLNEDSGVGQLREFVRASRPGVGNFVLSTNFPRKVLDDDKKSIKEANLKGTVVVQTLKN